LALAVLYFFRDPEKPVSASDREILSPSDGTIRDIRQAERVCISIYLSLFDIHVTRAPVSGQVRSVHYSPGQFLAAFRKKSFLVNENNLIEIRHETSTVLLRQIAGTFARRIVCRCRPGDNLVRGQKIGLIRFGSGIELCLPAGTALRVRAGDKVKISETVLGTLP
jgi:phosphatidylserine decarboxylase